MTTKQIEKYECLARMKTLDNKLLMPFEFIEISVKGKLYHQITRTMIRKSFQYFEDKDFEFSINLSIHDIDNEITYDYIIDSLRNYAHPHKVVFEILETDKIEAMVLGKGLAPGKHRLPVKVLVPEGVSVLTVEPDRISAVVKRKARK